jgi:hypothetical protein
VKDVPDGAGLADFGGVEFAEDVAFGDVEAVDAGVETHAGEVEFGLVATDFAVLGSRTVGAELLQINIDNVRGV